MGNPNTDQKIVLLLCGIAILLTTLFPPFHFIVEGKEFNEGYSFILNPPDAGRYKGGATINIYALLAHWASILTISAIAFFLLTGSENIIQKSMALLVKSIKTLALVTFFISLALSGLILLSKGVPFVIKKMTWNSVEIREDLEPVDLNDFCKNMCKTQTNLKPIDLSTLPAFDEFEMPPAKSD